MRHPSRITDVVFDIGNVLLPFDYHRTHNRIRPHCEVAPEERLSEISVLSVEHECGRLNEKEFFDALTILLGFHGDRQVLIEAWCDIFQVNEPIVDFARRLCDANIPCHLLSNIGETHSRYIEKTYPFFSLFDKRVYSWREGAMKPDSAIYTATIAKLGTEPACVFYIDDKPENIEAGRNAGFCSLAYDHTNHPAFLEALPETLKKLLTTA
jgi:FMN phosphatase YigB (HAD superfamily)